MFHYFHYSFLRIFASTLFLILVFCSFAHASSNQEYYNKVFNAFLDSIEHFESSNELSSNEILPYYDSLMIAFDTISQHSVRKGRMLKRINKQQFARVFYHISSVDELYWHQRAVYYYELYKRIARDPDNADNKDRLSLFMMSSYRKRKETLERKVDKLGYNNGRQSSIDSLENILDIYIEKINDFSSQLSHSPTTTKPFSIDQIQNQTQNHQVFLSYFVDDASFIYGIVLTKQLVKCIRLHKTQEVKALLDQTKSRTYPHRIRGYHKNSLQLYLKIFAPIDQIILDKNHVTQVVILPDQLMSLVHFDALLRHQPNYQLPKDSLPYLIHDYCFSFAHSISEFHRSSNNNSILKAKDQFLFVSPNFKKQNSPISTQLPQALDGGNLYQKIKPSFPIQPLFDYDANIDHISPIISSSNILHLHSHSFTDVTDPLKLAILLYSDDPNNHQVDTVYIEELINKIDTIINTQMVVLGSCSSGTGPITSGESVAGVSSAFAAMGAESIVYSLWQIREGATISLFEHFYKNLSNGMDKALAMRSAKLNVMKSKSKKGIDSYDYSDPIYWAGIVVWGKTNPLIINNYFTTSFNIFLFILIFYIIFYYSYRLFNK